MSKASFRPNLSIDSFHGHLHFGRVSFHIKRSPLTRQFGLRFGAAMVWNDLLLFPPSHPLALPPGLPSARGKACIPTSSSDDSMIHPTISSPHGAQGCLLLSPTSGPRVKSVTRTSLGPYFRPAACNPPLHPASPIDRSLAVSIEFPNFL